MYDVYLHRISQNHKGSSEDADLTLKRSEDISTKPVRPFFQKRLVMKTKMVSQFYLAL